MTTVCFFTDSIRCRCKRILKPSYRNYQTRFVCTTQRLGNQEKNSQDQVWLNADYYAGLREVDTAFVDYIPSGLCWAIAGIIGLDCSNSNVRPDNIPNRSSLANRNHYQDSIIYSHATNPTDMPNATESETYGDNPCGRTIVSDSTTRIRRWRRYRKRDAAASATRQRCCEYSLASNWTTHLPAIGVDGICLSVSQMNR